jgi:hypothetical protein
VKPPVGAGISLCPGQSMHVRLQPECNLVI